MGSDTGGCGPVVGVDRTLREDVILVWLNTGGST